MTTYSDASSPAINAFPVTKSDTTVFARPTKAIYVGVGGDVAVLLADDTEAVVFSSVPTGAFLPIRAVKVLSTGTTATLILGLN